MSLSKPRVVPVTADASPPPSLTVGAPPAAVPSAGLWGAYLASLDAQPLLTKAATSAVLSGVSDLLSQYLAKPEKGKPKKFNWRSFFHQVAIGAVFRGPLVHYWYMVLERLFAGWDPTALSTAVAKVLVDQTVMSPFFNWSYYWVIGTLEGTSPRRIQKRISQTFVPLMMANYRVWPLVNLVNFKLVPPNLRVLFGNVVAIFWVAYAISISK